MNRDSLKHYFIKQKTEEQKNAVAGCFDIIKFRRIMISFKNMDVFKTIGSTSFLVEDIACQSLIKEKFDVAKRIVTTLQN
jgi:hypothetical protein